MLCMSVRMDAQSFLEQALTGIVQGISQGLEIGTLKKVISTPSMQSQEMKEYLKKYNQGEMCMSNNDYYNAAQNYAGAWSVAISSSDPYLKKLWTSYGWMEDTKKKVISSCSLAGLENPFAVNTYQSVGTYNYGTTNTYSSGSNSSSSKSRVCSLCKGTGLKIKEYYSSGQRKYCSTCGKQVGTGHIHVRCDLCSGSGRLNY